MKTISLVMDGTPDSGGYSPVAAFSTQKKAEEWLEKHRTSHFSEGKRVLCSAEQNIEDVDFDPE